MEQKLTYEEMLVRYFSGEATSEEIAAVSLWLQESPDNQKTFNDYKQTFHLIYSEAISRKVSVDAEFANLKLRLDKNAVAENKVSKNNPFIRLLRIAAVLILVAVSSVIIYRYLAQVEDKSIAATGEHVEGKLPDGSSVALNAGSTLVFPEKFTGSKRAVKLKGEAFFEVQPDKAKPFIIESGKVRIEVVGTSFYVNNNNSSHLTVVIVKTGKVAVYKEGDDSRILLEPGERLIMAEGSESVQKDQNNDENFLAWKTGKIQFANTTLGDVAGILSSVYHVEVVFENKEMMNCRITATFEKQSLDAVMKIMQATLGFEYENANGRLVIKGKGCPQ